MAKSKKELSFEQSLKELEFIVKELESGDLPLERSIELYQQGMDYVKQCHNKLEFAERQVQKIVKENGSFSLEAFREDGDEA